MDFIKRANPKDINKLQLEGLVKSGAFDKLEINRKGIFSSIKINTINKVFMKTKLVNKAIYSTMMKIRRMKNSNLLPKKNGTQKNF